MSELFTPVMSITITQTEPIEISEKVKILNSPLITTIFSSKISNRIYKNRELFEFLTYIIPMLPGAFIAGGSLRSLIDKNDKINDIDVFFISENEIDATEKLNQAKVYFLGYPERYKKVFECPEGKLITYKDLMSGLKIQLINDKVITNPESLLNNFDFNACRFAIYGGWLYYSRQSIKDVKSKKLSLFNLIYPVATIKRVYKYMDKGYQVNDCLISIVRDLSAGGERPEENMTRVYID